MALLAVVDDVEAWEDIADADEVLVVVAKKIDSVAGPVLSSERSTVMDTAGLWYLSRGRYWRHTLRAPKWPSLSL